MAVTLVEAVVAGSAAVEASRTANFTVQPANGSKVVVAGGCYFSDNGADVTLDAPAGLSTAIQAFLTGGNLVGTIKDKTSTGADGTACTVAKSGTNRALAVVGLNLTGAAALDTSGQAGPTAGSSLSITTDGNVANDGSKAYMVVFRRSTSGAPTYTWSEGWTEVAKFVATGGTTLCSVYVAQKDVDSGGTVNGVWTKSTETNTALGGFIVVYPASNSAPTITAQPTKRMVAGIANPIPFTVTDAEGDSLTVAVACTAGTLTAPLAAGAGVTVNSGSGTNALSMSGTPGQFAAMGSISYTQAGYVADTITWDADDGELSAPQDVTAVTMWTTKDYGANLAAVNALLAARRFTSTALGSYTVTMESEDDSGNVDTDTALVTVSEVPPDPSPVPSPWFLGLGVRV